MQEFTARVESDRPEWVDVLSEKLLWTFQPPGSRLGELVRHGDDTHVLGVTATLCNEHYSFNLSRSAGRSAADISGVPNEVRPQPGVRALFIPPKDHAVWGDLSDVGRALRAELPERCRAPQKLRLFFVLKVGPGGLSREQLAPLKDDLQSHIKA